MSEHEQSAPSTQDSALRTQDPKYVRRIAVVRPGQWAIFSWQYPA